MTRYHKKIYFPDNEKLVNFTNKLNTLKWQYTRYCLKNLQYRVDNIQSLLEYIKELKLQYDDIFEYYKENNNIVKACYRISYKDFDFILILSDKKNIITIYINSRDDEHETLKENIYCRVDNMLKICYVLISTKKEV